MTKGEQILKPSTEDILSILSQNQTKQCNSITVKKPKPHKPTIPFLNVYQWSTHLTAEQDMQNPYLETRQFNQLVRRLKYGSDQLIAVVGFQGSGKTALMYKLSYELPNVQRVKWFSKKTVEQQFFDETKPKSYEIERNLELEGNTDLATRSKRGYIDEFELKKKAGKTLLNRITRENLLYHLQDKTLLIDLPDYDRNSYSHMGKNLNEIHQLWENINTVTEERKTNLVVFMQKELFHGHFFLGKMDVVELELLQPEQLTNYYVESFGSEQPFTLDALNELAFLSRGVFRRFKKYVRICLDSYYEDRKPITRDAVCNSITLKQLAKDMELELQTLYPRRKELRKSSVILLRYLQQHGRTDQQTLSQKLFGLDKASEMTCSRLLSRLEAYGYVERQVFKNNQKLVSLSGY